MMKRQNDWRAHLVVAVVAACVGVAGAGTTTIPPVGTEVYVDYVGLVWGTGSTPIVKVSSEIGKNGVYAGPEVLNISYTSNSAHADSQPVLAYCVDAQQYANWDWTQYHVANLENVPVNQYTSAGMGVTKAKDVRQLFYMTQANSPTSPTHDAAIQVALWEIINETAGSPYDVDNGAWTTVGSDPVLATARSWLSLINADNATGGGDDLKQYYGVMAVASSTAQDFAIVLPANIPPPVPEPLTMGSVFLAVSGLGVYFRKRLRVAAV